MLISSNSFSPNPFPLSLLFIFSCRSLCLLCLSRGASPCHMLALPRPASRCPPLLVCRSPRHIPSLSAFHPSRPNVPHLVLPLAPPRVLPHIATPLPVPSCRAAPNPSPTRRSPQKMEKSEIKRIRQQAKQQNEARRALFFACSTM